MSLKPAVIRKVSAEPAAMAKAIGPKLGKQFLPNPKIAEYAFVLRFPSGVVSGRAIAQALRKVSTTQGPILLAGSDFTIEARQVAQAEACDLVSLSEFGWTDAIYADRYGR